MLPFANVRSVRHGRAVTLLRIRIVAIFAGKASAYSPSIPSTECKGMSHPQAVKSAREQKRGMLTRSVRSEQENFASDAAEVAKDSTGYVAKVSFTGRNGQRLVGLIDQDCYVGWTKQ